MKQEAEQDTPTPDDDVLDVAEVVLMLRMGRNTIYDLCARNEIPHRRIGRRIRFSRSALLKWLEGER